MESDETQEIVNTLRDELISKSTLFLAPVGVSSERIIYFYIYSVLENDPEQTVVWLSLKKPRNKVMDTFAEYGFDVQEYSDRMWFIDIKKPGKEPEKNTLYCESQTDYTKMGSHISKLFNDYPGAILVIDDMNILTKDSLQVVENFIKFVEKTVTNSNGTIVTLLGKDVLSSENEGLIKSFFDVVIDITNSGEMHAEIGLKSLHVSYTISDGKINFEYIQKKIKRDRLKILIVDDEPDIPELIKLSLSNEPYDFIVAYSGEQAVDMTLQELPDLILLDIMMPDMDGYEVVEELNKDKSTRDIAIIMVSAKTRVEDKLKGMELGIDDYISKPFDERELNARIKMVMKRYGWKNL
ncbi:response regulator transcription factor [Methanohalobium sp.]|uniref:response regulator transcription factor n=1 Tax=Methanohalobium sp. TaxID=2837493 RepID=UPI0025E8A69C|nr:response regulator [Methanohalobium sp.]